MNELPTQCEPFSQVHDEEVAAAESGLAARHKAGERAEADLKFATKKFPADSFSVDSFEQESKFKRKDHCKAVRTTTGMSSK